jgi:hypothetical protein
VKEDTLNYDPATARAQYEVLRLTSLGEPLPPEARSGLALFLRRGMWAWTKALTKESNQKLGYSPSPGNKVSPENRAIIQVFAAMATSNGRTQ